MVGKPWSTTTLCDLPFWGFGFLMFFFTIYFFLRKALKLSSFLRVVKNLKDINVQWAAKATGS
jgi:hypothetical protein